MTDQILRIGLKTLRDFQADALLFQGLLEDGPHRTGY